MIAADLGCLEYRDERGMSTLRPFAMLQGCRLIPGYSSACGLHVYFCQDCGYFVPWGADCRGLID